MKYLFAIFSLAFLLLGSCDISKPHIPQWDVDLTVPLMNERFLVSELADSVNIVVGDGDVLTLTGTGSAETPPFGEVNFTPSIDYSEIPLVAGLTLDLKVPIMDPTGSVFLSYGQLEQGALGYYFDLDSPALDHVTLTLPDVHTPAGTPLQLVSSSNANWQSADLAGCYFGTENSGSVLDSLWLQLNVQSTQPEGEQIGSMGFRINSQLGFDEFQGYLYSYVRSLEGTVSAINIDYPLELEQAVQLQTASVYLEVTNEFGFGAEFHGTIKATNNRTGQTRTINVQDDSGGAFIVNPATQTGPVITELSLTNNVSNLLQIMPDTIEIFDSYLLINGGGNGAPGFVNEDNKLYCSYQVDAPFEFVLYDHTFELNEPVEIKISQDARENILNRVLDAALTVGITNKIPVGFTATAYLSDQPGIDLLNPATYAYTKTLNVHSSQYTGPDVNQYGEQQVQIALNQAELDLFSNPLVYMLWTFSFEPSNGPVTIYASPADYIQVKGMLTAGVHVEVNE